MSSRDTMYANEGYMIASDSFQCSEGSVNVSCK